MPRRSAPNPRHHHHLQPAESAETAPTFSPAASPAPSPPPSWRTWRRTRGGGGEQQQQQQRNDDDEDVNLDVPQARQNVLAAAASSAPSSPPSSSSSASRKRKRPSCSRSRSASVDRESESGCSSLLGVKVKPHVRRAGPYLLGPKLGTSPVKSIVQCLARNKGGDRYFLIKMLTLSHLSSGEETQDERHGKMLLHTEHSLLSLLEGQEGVVRMRDFFTEQCYHEEEREDRQLYYNGRVSRRVCLVTDCLTPNDFSAESQRYVNLQHYVIKQQQLPEKLALVIFYNVARVVNGLHERNVVHRDLKLGNIVLHKSSKRVTLTNFCLGKYLMNDDDLLRDQRGSPAYISPDVLSGKPYRGKPSDMWALGVVLYTMLYGQFPFYDVVPAELFNRIKSAEFNIPDDGRVSEDTKGVIRRLLVIDPAKRMTAQQLQAALERIIGIWRAVSVAAPSSSSTTTSADCSMQVVPEVKAPAATTIGGGGGISRSSLNLLLPLNLLHLNARCCPEENETDESDRGTDNSTGHGRIKMTRALEDARPLSADEYRTYGPFISRMRQNNPCSISSTGQPLGDSSTSSTAAGTATSGLVGSGGDLAGGSTHVLLSNRSPLLATIREMATQQHLQQQRHRLGTRPPLPATPVDASVPVIEQDTVLDLSSRSGSRAVDEGVSDGAGGSRMMQPRRNDVGLPNSGVIVAQTVPQQLGEGRLLRPQRSLIVIARGLDEGQPFLQEANVRVLQPPVFQGDGASYQNPQSLGMTTVYLPQQPQNLAIRQPAIPTERQQEEQDPQPLLEQHQQAVELRDALMRIQATAETGEGNNEATSTGGGTNAATAAAATAAAATTAAATAAATPPPSQPPPPPSQVMSLREALMRMNPEAVVRSDQVITRSQRQQDSR